MARRRRRTLAHRLLIGSGLFSWMQKATETLKKKNLQRQADAKELAELRAAKSGGRRSYRRLNSIIKYF